MTARFPSDDMLSAGSVLNPASWPKDDDEKIFYGDKQVLQLAKTLHVDSRQAVSEFRIFIKSKCPDATLTTLQQRLSCFQFPQLNVKEDFHV